MRIPTAPSATASGTPVAFALSVACWISIDRTTDGAVGAAALMYLWLECVAVFAVHPGLPAPAGIVSVAAPSLPEKISIAAPPGVPVPGSSAEPIAGKRRVGSFSTRTSFSLVPLFCIRSLVPKSG